MASPGHSPQVREIGKPASRGNLIVNADDWGRSEQGTDRILDCHWYGAISSVSAMVFMEDSERAAAIARQHHIDTGLHLNFTTPFSTHAAPARLVDHQQRISRYLRSYRLAQAIFHPGLIRSFDYVMAAQVEEFTRLYQRPPQRMDGHHHMHLCANIILARLLPANTVVRRNFSFRPGEKSFANRIYRRVIDTMLSRRHHLTDFFYSLTPLEPAQRLQEVFSLATQFVVEVECHPAVPEEYQFLTGGDFFRCLAQIPIPHPAMSHLV